MKILGKSVVTGRAAPPLSSVQTQLGLVFIAANHTNNGRCSVSCSKAACAMVKLSQLDILMK